MNDGVMPKDLLSKMGELANRDSVFDREDIPNPPWEELPNLTRDSMGWRMGAGEDYILGFRKWFLHLDEKRRSGYIFLYPEPDTWQGFYQKLPG